MSGTEVGRLIEQVGVVPVVRVASAALAVRACEALLAGGVSVLEITLTVPDALDVVSSLARRFAGRAVVGAGTVLDARQVEACIDAGAAFIVSPGFDAATVQAARARGVAVIPGALTPTEVLNAIRAGAEMVKIFPCSAVGGPSYIRALRGPMPDAKFLPTGGVTLETAPAYVEAGAVAVGMGSELLDVAALAAGSDSLITERARQLVAAIRLARSRQR